MPVLVWSIDDFSSTASGLQLGTAEQSIIEWGFCTAVERKKKVYSMGCVFSGDCF